MDRGDRDLWLRSAPPPPPSQHDISAALGIELSRGTSFDIAVPSDLSQHVTLLGVTGSGKTTSAERLAGAALGAGVGVVIVDAKGGGLRGAAQRLARAHGVDYRHVLPGSPTSLGYNPCAVGSRSQVADKLVSAFSHGPNAEVYRLIGQEAIAIIVGLLRATGETVTVRRIRQELDRRAMPGLSQAGSDVAPQLASDLLELSDRSKLAGDALDGMRARLGALLHGEYGELFDNSLETLDLYGALDAGAGVTYIGLPALAVSADTALMARVLIQDLKQVAHRRLIDGGSNAAVLILDEFAALDDPAQLCDLLRQAREARVCTVVSTQHLPDPLVAYALRASLLGAGLVIAHRVSHDDAEAVANLVGTEKATEVTHQVAQGSNTGQGTVRRVDRYVINPNVIKQLATGEAIVLSTVGRRRAAAITVYSGGFL